MVDGNFENVLDEKVVPLRVPQTWELTNFKLWGGGRCFTGGLKEMH